MSQHSKELQLFKHKGNFKEMSGEEGESVTPQVLSWSWVETWLSSLFQIL